MPRVKRGVVRRQKRKKLSKLTKGYFQNKSKLYKFMREAAEKAGDEPTADLLTPRLEVHEKTAWMLRSLLED